MMSESEEEKILPRTCQKKVIIPANMDDSSTEMSMHLYYAFGGHSDTCATSQKVRRTSCEALHHYVYLSTINEYCNILGTGSMFEGTRILSRSDSDCMLVYEQFQVYPVGYNGAYNVSICEERLQMVRSEHTRPGFCLLNVVGENIEHTTKFYSNHFQKLLIENFESLLEAEKLSSQVRIQGPALTRYTQSHHTSCGTDDKDVVLCLVSKYWPDECRNWSGLFTWPSVTLQEAIKRKGFHIVRVGFPLSPERDKEWRMSFSVAEKMLIHSFNPTQLTCAVVMKWLLNHYIKPVVPDSINSYHIKTLVLWSVEQDIDQKWEPQYFVQCLKKLLTNLMNCISVGKLTHYFIPDNNLFLCKVTDANKEKLFCEVEALQVSVVETCTKLLHVLGINISPSELPSNELQAYSLKNIAFKDLHASKLNVQFNVIKLVTSVFQKMVYTWNNCRHDRSQNLFYQFLVRHIISYLESNVSYDRNAVFEKQMTDKYSSYFNNWSGSILYALYKSCEITREANENPKTCDEISLRDICGIGKHMLVGTFENTSTTGCIKMALLHICEESHYHAVPFLNRSLNIIDQIDNRNCYTSFEMENPSDEFNFTEYMHLYNDQEAIENELHAEFLNDRVLHPIPFNWLEMRVLPQLLQLELTHTFYKVNMLRLPTILRHEFNPFQYWNPIPLTYFLLFICHKELLNSVTFLDPKCLRQDIFNLVTFTRGEQHLRLDECPSALNLINWCLLQAGLGMKQVVQGTVGTVRAATSCDKTLFSHLFIQHVIGAVIKPDVRCI